MRVSGAFSLAGAVVLALMIADLLAHSRLTNNLVGAGVTESRLIAGR
jgi:hypothetical protein